MKVLIRNLGPIRGNTQTIDLSKRFYIFVGLNNSGKTYVSQLLWTIFNQDVIRKFSRSHPWEDITWKGEGSQAVVGLTQELIDNILTRYANFLEKQIIATLNADLFPIQDISLELHSDSLTALKQDYFQANFNIGTEEEGENKEIQYLTITKDRDSLSFQIKQEALPDELFEIIPKSIFNRDLQDEIKSSIIQGTIQLLLKHKHSTIFLPASRVFYPIFYQYIYEIERKSRAEEIERLLNLIERRQEGNEISSDSVKKIKRSQRRYTEPMNDVLERTYRLNLKANIVPYYQDILEKLGRIMGGDIVMKSLEGISPIEFYFNFGKEEGDLPMYLASSSVNQLTLLNLYLKYWVEEKNNFLMMDEPEENVHPENQIKLLELLIQFATQNDNKMLMTTHSPLMANAVNNYLYLDMLKNDYDCDVERLVEEYNLKLIDTDTSISKDDVGVYFFNGKRIIDYEANDYGIYFRDFSSIIESVDKSRRILNDYIDLQDAGDE